MRECIRLRFKDGATSVLVDWFRVTEDGILVGYYDSEEVVRMPVTELESGYTVF